jgi:hypothetical protein
MDRRRYLLGVAGAAGLAGCAGFRGQPAGSGNDTDDTPGREVVTAPRRPTFDDLDLPVSKRELVRGAALGSIPAISEPAFGPDWRDRDRTLAPDDLVVGVEYGGEARAYPLSVLTTHEVVNDTLGSRPLLVTYCPLCASGVVAERRVDGEPSTFSASGYLYRSDLVLYDHATGSLWSQLLARAITGPATGTELPLVPSSLTTWGRWREANPGTRVLLPPPASETVTAPLEPVRAGTAGSGHVGVPGVALDVTDDRLPPRELVVGVTAPDATTAYPLSAVREAGVVEDWVGDLPVVVAAEPLPAAYVRVVDGEVLSFSGGVDDGRLRGGGSTWSLATGEALDGPHEGASLRRANTATPMYWFAWVEFHPGTAVYGRR